ncbi:MAG: adenylate cyclase regulatory domain-containing protein [Actinomycetota bacterium]
MLARAWTDSPGRRWLGGRGSIWNTVDSLVELGILTPITGDTFSPGDARRARLVQSLERAGVPLEGMASAVRDGALSLAFLDLTAYDRFAGLTGTTFRELSATTGIPLELLMVLREAIGFALPTPDDYVREDELQVVPAIELQLSKGFNPVVIERWLRVYGESLRRIAETEADWWHSEVEVPLLESGMTEGQMLEVSNEFTPQMAPLLEKALVLWPGSSPTYSEPRRAPGSCRWEKGLLPVESLHQVAQVLSCELPLERLGAGLVASLKGEKATFDLAEVGKVVGGEHLPLDDGVVDLDLVQP